jgi:hypothetical protein
MTYDGPAPLMSDAVAAGPRAVGGPAAYPTPNRLRTTTRRFPRRTPDGQVRGIGSVRGERHPARLTRAGSPRVLPGTRERRRRLWPDVR